MGAKVGEVEMREVVVRVDDGQLGFEHVLDDLRRPLDLRPGLVRLAQLAQSRGVSVPVVPVGLGYSQAPPRPFSRAALCFGAPLTVPAKGDREATRQFNSRVGGD